MTLGQFAIIVGAPPRWVQNAWAALRLRGPYADNVARRLSLAREIAGGTGMPLVRAYSDALAALAAWPRERTCRIGRPDDMVSVVVDLERFHSTFAVRLAFARNFHEPRVRGPKPHRARGALSAATRLGIDVTLFDESLNQTPAARLKRLEDMSEFFRSARVVGQ